MFLYLKSLHIIFIVSWFAGLFYIVRLFIYHTETKDMEKPKSFILQDQYKLMSRRLWYIISWPAMILASVFGIWMLVESPGYLKQPYMHLKLGFVVVLYVYHLCCHAIFKQLQRDEIRYTSTKLRLWNEVATLLLVSIVFIIVLKSTIKLVWAVGGFIIIAIMLMLGVRIYKKMRMVKEEKSAKKKSNNSANE